MTFLRYHLPFWERFSAQWPSYQCSDVLLVETQCFYSPSSIGIRAVDSRTGSDHLHNWLPHGIALDAQNGSSIGSGKGGCLLHVLPHCADGRWPGLQNKTSQTRCLTSRVFVDLAAWKSIVLSTEVPGTCLDSVDMWRDAW